VDRGIQANRGETVLHREFAKLADEGPNILAVAECAADVILAEDKGTDGHFLGSTLAVVKSGINDQTCNFDEKDTDRYARCTYRGLSHPKSIQEPRHGRRSVKWAPKPDLASRVVS
jgi:hypothetical protein